MSYADMQRRQVRAPIQPRNIAAADRARARGETLVVSYVGDTPWRCPTVYCDSGRRYSWDFIRGLHAIVAVRPGVAVLDALRRILEEADTLKQGFPMLADVDAREVACIVYGKPVGLWQVRRGSNLWQQYFPTPA